MRKIFLLMMTALLAVTGMLAQTVVTIGTGTTNAGGTNGTPIYRSSSTSSFHHSKSIQLLTASQLVAAGVLSGSTFTTFGYNKTNTFQVSGSNAWTLNVYLKNSSATALASGTAWSTMISGATLAYTATINSANNLPATAGYWNWTLTTPFTYNGGAVECYIEWFPAGTLTSPFTGGAFNWEYTTTTGNQAMGTSSSSTIPASLTNYTTQTRFYNTRITYTSPPACSGTPNAGTASTSMPSTCPGGSAALSLSGYSANSGLTFQWQSSPAGANTFTDISGATSFNYNATGIAASTDYQCVVTCTNGGATATSNIVSVTVPTSIASPTVTTTPATYGYGNSLTLSLSGLTPGLMHTYQWQQNVSGGGWTNISGATNATYTTPVLTNPITTGYRCNVTACTGTLTATSNEFVPMPSGYCAAGSTGQASWFSSLSSSGGSTNLSYNATSGAAGGYQNLTATQIVTNFESSPTPTTISVTNGGPTCGNAVWVDWNNNDIFETTERVASTTTYVTTWTSAAIAVPAGQAVGNYRMRIVTDYNATSPSNPCAFITRGEFIDATFAVSAPPSCLAPAALNNTNVGTTGVNHSWNAPTPPPASGYEWAFTTSATPPASGTATTGTTASSTGLTFGTTYYLHVRSDCGGGSYSNWVTATHLFDYCLPTYTNGGTTDNITQVTLGTLSDVPPANTSPFYFNRIAVQNAIPDLPQSTSPTLNVTFGADGSQYNGVWIDFDQNGTFDATEFFTSNSNAGANGTANISITVPATAVLGNTRMRIRGGDDAQPTSAQACGAAASSYGMALDYRVNITAPPACLPPSTLANTLVSATAVNHSWTAPATPPASGYEWAVTTSATAPASGTTTTATTASSTGLTTGSTYYLHVRSNCGGGVYSSWQTSAPFTLNYCTPAPTSVDGVGITNVTYGTVNNTTGAETGNYGDYSAQSSSHQQASSVPVSIKWQTDTYDYLTKIWVDWNNDLDFDDAGEEVASGTSTTTGVTAPTTHQLTLNVAIPGTQAVGNYRMRIGSIDAGTVIPCYTGSYGSYEDYTLTVVTGVPCSGAPTGVAISPTSAIGCGTASANFIASTTSGGTGITYQWQSSPAGANTFTSISGATDYTYSATGVTTSTDYRCVVTCSGNSTNSNVATITIEAIPANDDPCNATNMVLNTTYSGFTNCATVATSPAEPTIASSVLNNTVWFKFTPAATGNYQFVVTTPTASQVSAGFWFAGFTTSTACPAPTWTNVIPSTNNNFNVGAAGQRDSIGFNLNAGTEYYFVLDGVSGAYGEYTIKVQLPGVGTGVNNACYGGPASVTISAANANNNTWIPIRERSGNIICEINANGNDLGATTFNMYKNVGAIRTNQSNPYLDRNFTIDVTTQPVTGTGTALVRLYFTQDEFAALQAAAGTAMATNALKLTKNGQACGGTFTPYFTGGDSLLAVSAVGTIGSDHYIEFATKSFSSFFTHFPPTGGGTLAVSLTDVKGAVTGATNTISWSTVSENDNVKFVVERSTNGSNFAPIGEVASRATLGNSNTTLAYSFVDANPVQGKQYYRLQMISASGVKTYSQIVTLRRGGGKLEIADVRPNPTTGIVYFNVLGANNNVNVVVRTLDGKQVIRKNLVQAANFSVDLTPLATGMYILEAVDVRTQEKAIFKVVKE
jgi:hypothetical protein